MAVWRRSDLLDLIFVRENMINLVCKTVCTLTVLAASSTLVMAADSSDLTVGGMITPGGSCVPLLTWNGVVSYGDIGSNTLSQTEYNVLAQKVLDMSITCNMPTRVALNISAGRSGTLVGGAEVNGFGIAVLPIAGGGADNKATGIGLDGSGNKIGGMAINIKSGVTTIDGSKDVDILEGGSTAYTLKSNQRTLSPIQSSVAPGFSWGATGSVVPLAFKFMTTVLDIQAYLNKGSELDLTKEIKLNGLVTLELNYL